MRVRIFTEGAWGQAYYAGIFRGKHAAERDTRRAAMQEPQFSASDHTPDFFSSALHHSNSLFTPKRIGYGLAGAFVLAGAALALNNSGAASQTPPKPQTYILHSSTNTSDTPDAIPADTPEGQTSAGATTRTTFSATTNGNGTTNTHLNVNGQDIPVPQSGSTSQTITNSNGSTTTVDVHGNTTTQGATDNTSNSSFSLNVHSSSSSSGGTTRQ